MSIPFATLMLILAFIAVKYGPVKLGHLLLGITVGLSLSGTAIGTMVTQMAETLTAAAIDAFTGVSATATPFLAALVMFGGGG